MAKKEVDNSPDDKLTEKQALAQAKKEGIEFVDSYMLVQNESMTPLDGTEYKTQKEAEKAAGKLKGYSVAQVRRRA